MALNKSHENLLVQEYNHTWIHYRHLEETRVKYINFLFTIFFASITAYGAIFKLSESRGVMLILGFVFLFLLSALTLYLFIAVTRIGLVLASYDKCMGDLREVMFADCPAPESIYKRRILPRDKKHVFSVQRSSQRLMGIAMIVIDAVLLALLIVDWNFFAGDLNRTDALMREMAEHQFLIRGCLSAIFLGMVFLEARLWRTAKRMRREMAAKVERTEKRQ